MDYSSYLNDNLDSLVPSVLGHGQFYSTIILTLETKSVASRLSLYDYNGVFITKPAYLYFINGRDTTYLGKFTGEQYEVFINLPVMFLVVANKIAIRKFDNYIPQKVQVFGLPYQQGSIADLSPMRFPIDIIIASINTGMDYQPWLNDSLNNLVESVWGSKNNQ